MNYYVDEANGNTVRFADDTVIANFHIKVIDVHEYINNERVILKKYLLQFYTTEYIAESEIDAKHLEKFVYSDISDALLLSPTVQTAGKEMAYCIKDFAKEITSKKIHLFNKLGWHKIGDVHCYCAGDTLIGDCPGEYIIASELSEKYKLEVEPLMDEETATKYMFDLINIDSAITSIVFTTGMLGILRQLFKDADIKVPCCLYIFGDTQTRKTTIAIFCTALYGRNSLQDLSGISTLRVSSTEFKSEECIDSLKDATFVFDDLYKENDNKLLKDYEKRVRNIIRNFADNSSRSTTKSSFENNCQVIITAEYPLNTKTDIGRLMLLHVDHPIDSKRLSDCQEHPLSVSTFYYYFIRWISRNYDDIVSDIAHEFKAFRMTDTAQKFRYERLREQAFLLDYAFKLFLRYASELGCVIRNIAATENEFCVFINKALARQEKIVKPLENTEVKVINFSFELLQFLNNGTIVPGDKSSPCFIKGNHLYITNREFGIHLKDKFGRPFSAKEVTKYFRDRYISETYADNRLKKINNKCYLILNLSELNKDANNDSNSIENLFF